MSFDPKNSPAFLISRTAHVLRESVAQILKSAGVPMSAEEHTILLCLVQAKRELRVGELAQIAARDATTVKRQLNALERHGFVALTRDESDRRAVLILPTAAGQGVVEDAMPEIERLRTTAMHGVPDGDREVLVHTLQRMHANLLALNKEEA